MRILIAIPHYFGQASAPRYGSESGAASERIAALTQCICALRQLFGGLHQVINIEHRRTQPANQDSAAEVHVVLCTTGSHHLVDRLPVSPDFFHHQPSDVEPRLLGFQCHAVLRDRWGNYDYYGYLEDDLILHDPWLFAKLAWFNGHVGPDCLLLPNRFERGRERLAKVYVDGDIPLRVTAGLQNIEQQRVLKTEVLGRAITLQRPANPHSGCFFLSSEQLRRWIAQPYFLDRDTRFIGPLESAATLGILRTFRIYKPAWSNADFLEIEHADDQFLRQIRMDAPPRDVIKESNDTGTKATETKATGTKATGTKATGTKATGTKETGEIEETEEPG